MAASVRVCCALRIISGGATPLRTVVGAVQFSHLASRPSAASLQRIPALPVVPATTWQQVRHGSFFNKLTADQLWKGVVADSGSGAKKGRGKRTKRKMKKDLNRGQKLGEGRGGFLWPGLNAPILVNGIARDMGRRNKIDQEQVQADMVHQREQWERMKRQKVMNRRGWTGNTWGGVYIPKTDGKQKIGSHDDFEAYVIDLKAVFNMTAKEGRRRSISCLVAVGNGKGCAGFALGKAPDRMAAIRKARDRAMNFLRYIELFNNHTIYHDIEAKVKRTTLRMKKQNKGYGLHCHRAVITLCKLIGIKNMYCKLEGSSNVLNITRALFLGLASQETHQALADKKQLHVVEFQSHTGVLPVVMAHPTEGARADPEPEDVISNAPLNWADVQAAQGTKFSFWSSVKRNHW